MRKMLVGVIILLVLSGCGTQPVYETMGDVWAQSEPAVSPGRMEVPLPEGAQMEVMDGLGNSFYQVGNWELWTKIFDAGDLKATLHNLSGLSGASLTVLNRKVGEFNCSETTWTTTAEDGLHIVRAGILDDGNYHYCLCLSAPAEEAEAAGEVFSRVLQTVSITGTAP